MKNILALLLLVSGIYAGETTVRPDIDPALHGMWVAKALSKDRGATPEVIEETSIGWVEANSIALMNGNSMKVSGVVVPPSSPGVLKNVIHFSNSAITYGVTTSDKVPGAYLLQVFNPSSTVGGSPEESIRFIIYVRR